MLGVTAMASAIFEMVTMWKIVVTSPRFEYQVIFFTSGHVAVFMQ
jgi:hypothetical protein